jgi:hypothetical protein
MCLFFKTRKRVMCARRESEINAALETILKEIFFNTYYRYFVGRNTWPNPWYTYWIPARAEACGWWRRISHRTRWASRSTKKTTTLMDMVQWFYTRFTLRIFIPYCTVNYNLYQDTTMLVALSRKRTRTNASECVLAHTLIFIYLRDQC